MFFDPAYQSLKNGLVGYWSPVATGPTGLQLLDLSGQNNNGTLTNMDAPTDWVQSPYGTVLDFNGSTDYITSPSFTGQPIRFANIWIRPNATVNSSSTFQVLFQLRFGTNNSWHISLGPATILLTGEYITITDTSTAGSNFRVGVTDGGSLAANEWSMLSFAWTGTTYQIYVNGVPRATSTTGIPQLPTANQLILGCFNGDGGGPRGFFSGQIAEAFYSSRFFEATEIIELFCLGPSGFVSNKPYPSKRKWWPGVKTPKPHPIITTQRGIKSGSVFYDPKAEWLKNGLVGHWCPSLTGATGTQLLDLSGQNNNGTLTNMDAPTDWVQTEKGLALDFDGSNDYVANCGNTASFAFVHSNYVFTASIWFNLNSLSSRCSLFGTTNTGSELGFLMVHEFGAGLGTNSIRFVSFNGNLGQSKDLRSPNSVIVAGWNHAVVIGRGTAANSAMVINGQAVTTTAAQDSANGTGNTTRNLSIGNDTRSAVLSNVLWTAGKIAEAAIWNRTLTTDEIQKLYNSGPGGFASRKPYRRSSYSPAPKKIFKSRIDRKRSVSLVHSDHDNEWVTNGLAGFWCPSLTSPTGTQLLDLSGQNNNGTLTNMDAATDWVDSPYGSVLDFDGTNDFIHAPAVLTTAPPALSASVWFKTTAVGGVGASKVIFGKYQTTPSAARSFFMRINDSPDNRLGVNISADGTLNAPVFKQWYSTQAINDGLWKHAVFTLQSNTLTVYINGTVASGTFVLNGAVNTVFWNSDTPFIIGASNTVSSPNSFFPGQIVGACYWFKALTASEVQTLYQLGPRMGFSRTPSRSPTWMVDPIYNQTNRLSSFPG